MSDPAPDQRPRPQYGEYATPEEQRSRIRQPDVSWSLESGQAPEEPPAPAPTAIAPVSGVRTEPTRGRVVDRIVTVALLAYGLINIVTTIPSFLDYGAYADTMLSLMGVEVGLTDPAAGRPWGVAGALVLGLGWLVTALLSWWSMNRGRLSFWIPLVGGIVFTFLAGTLVVIPLMNDPAVWNALLDSVR